MKGVTSHQIIADGLFMLENLTHRGAVGADRIMWSSDYPHVGANWPNSRRTIAADYSGVPYTERDAMLAGTALQLYRFDER